DQRRLRCVQPHLVTQQRLPEHAELRQQHPHRDHVREAGEDSRRRHRRRARHQPPPRYSVKTPRTASRNAPATNSVILNRRSLANELSITATMTPSAIAFATSAAIARATEPRRAVEASPHGAT